MHDPRVVEAYLGTSDAAATGRGTAGLLAEAAHAGSAGAPGPGGDGEPGV